MDKIIILGKGKSLERLSEVIKYANNCVFVDNFSPEIEYFWDILKDKNVYHFTNGMIKGALDKKYYDLFNIKESYARSTIFPKLKYADNQIKLYTDYYENILNVKMIHVSEEYHIKYKTIKNTGIYAVLWASETLGLHDIWICGFDFHQDNYFLNDNKGIRMMKGRYDDAISDFIDIIKTFPNITYHIVLSKKINKNTFKGLQNINII